MDWKVFFTVFATVFLAELGDKTQLATMLFAADAKVSRWLVFAGASLALIACSAIGVIAGSLLSATVNQRHLQAAAGVAFILIGIFTLYRAQ